MGISNIESLESALREYDVDQGGWEHEDKDLEFNVIHVLKELVRARRKDMHDRKVVRDELAPDTLQHSLRLARWTGYRSEFVLPHGGIEEKIDKHARVMRTSRRLGAFAVGEILLADYAHSLDHESERAGALQRKYDRLPDVSQALTSFAMDSATEFHFNLEQAFHSRIENLRERFVPDQPK